LFENTLRINFEKAKNAIYGGTLEQGIKNVDPPDGPPTMFYAKTLENKKRIRQLVVRDYHTVVFSLAVLVKTKIEFLYKQCFKFGVIDQTRVAVLYRDSQMHPNKP